MKVKAYAKLNLCLNVVERLPDGYHDLNMIMVPIDLFDTIDLSFDIKTTIQANRRYLPNDERNTIIKVINGLREIYGFNDQFQIKLTKNIPSQAGLGGGSADAAIVIKTLNALLDLKMTQAEMLDFGKSIGADVPFCIINKPAYVSGIGEKIEPFDFDCPFYLFLVKPHKGVSTKLAFENLDYEKLTHPNAKRLKDELIACDYDGIIANMGNDLEQSALKLVPEIGKLKSELLDFGFDHALMSGSGSTVFAITTQAELIDRAVYSFQRKYPFVKKSKIIDI